jgi:hypothetical protein
LNTFLISSLRSSCRSWWFLHSSLRL